MTTRGCYIETSPALSAELTLGLEAQQKYSTGYIQCMHEVHNMLLTCEWMDKTLGSHLLNHLLKSLPRSAGDKLQQDFLPLADQGMGVTLSGEPVTARHLQKKRPTAHVADHRESPTTHGPQLGVLEMWRPWWWLVKQWVWLFTRHFYVSYRYSAQKTNVGRFCSSDHYCRHTIIYRSFLYFPSEVDFL